MSETPTPPESNREITRLSVNINEESRFALESWSSYRNQTVTESIRQAIGIMSLFYGADAEGRMQGQTNEDGDKRLIIHFPKGTRFPFEFKE